MVVVAVEEYVRVKKSDLLAVLRKIEELERRLSKLESKCAGK